MEFRDGPLRIAEVWHNGAQRGATSNTMELYSESQFMIVVTLTDALRSEVWCAGSRLSIHGAHARTVANSRTFSAGHLPFSLCSVVPVCPNLNEHALSSLLTTISAFSTLRVWALCGRFTGAVSLVLLTSMCEPILNLASARF